MRLIDLAGRRFGSLLVEGRGEQRSYRCGANVTPWVCLCECGTRVEVSASHLKSGASKSCGCSRTTKLIGRRFGFLTVESISGRTAEGVLRFNCICDCGKNSVVTHGTIYARKSCGCKQERPFGEVNCHQLFIQYAKGAMTRGIEWGLSKEQFKLLTKQECHYCGEQPTSRKAAKGTSDYYIYNGIDRVDNEAGYTIANSVPCCARCNRAKGILTKEAFIAMAVAVAKHHATTSH